MGNPASALNTTPYSKEKPESTTLIVLCGPHATPHSRRATRARARTRVQFSAGARWPGGARRRRGRRPETWRTARHTERQPAHAPYGIPACSTHARTATLSGAESPEARPPTPARELVAGGGLNAAERADARWRENSARARALWWSNTTGAHFSRPIDPQIANAALGGPLAPKD